MKRRGFFAGIAGMFVAPKVLAKPEPKPDELLKLTMAICSDKAGRIDSAKLVEYWTRAIDPSFPIVSMRKRGDLPATRIDWPAES